MPARVDDALLNAAAEAVLSVAQSMTTQTGLKIRCPMDLQAAKSAVLAAMVQSLGYPNAILPTGWTEVSFGEDSK